MPPALSDVITVVTLADRNRYDEEYAEYEKRQRDARNSWFESWNQTLEKANIRLSNIKESLSTCKDGSLDHWQQELRKQEEVIVKLESERVPDSFPGSEPREPGFKAVKGGWMLTEADDTCGEWQEN